MLSRATLLRASIRIPKATTTSLRTTLLSTQARLPTHLLSLSLRPRLFTTHTPLSLSSSPTSAMASTSDNTSGITPSSLESTLRRALDATHVEIHDMSGGCGQAFNAVIVSSVFEKKAVLARHRLVNAALKAEIAAIHAWTPRCYTPEQWEREKEKEKEREG